MYLFALNMPYDWFFLVNHFLTDDSLQSAKINKKAVLWQVNSTYDAVVKFDTYRNLQRHRAVLPVIARHFCRQTVKLTEKKTTAKHNVG